MDQTVINHLTKIQLRKTEGMILANMPENIESASGQFLDEDPQSVVENEIDFSAILQPGVELSSGESILTF